MTKSDEASIVRSLRRIAKALESMQIDEDTDIIHCEDCKWWSNDEYRECSNPNYDKVWNTPRGFYCGFAERRTDE